MRFFTFALFSRSGDDTRVEFSHVGALCRVREIEAIHIVFKSSVI